MSTFTTAKTVGELAAENPAATRIFEDLGIDYCCGGTLTLEDACRAHGVAVERVRESLAKAAEERRDTAPDRQWSTAALGDLIAHIQGTHHQYTRAAIGRLRPLFEKVSAVHGERHPELAQMQETFEGLAQELTMHLMKEEHVLFPYIARMEEAVLEKSAILPAPFGTVENPVSMMIHEHDSAGEALRSLRAGSNGYSAPADACTSFRALYQGLAELEADLHQHIHLENNILFPRAIEMERAH